MKSETLFIRQYPKYGYEVRTEMVSHPDDSEPIEMLNAYTLSGAYIGNTSCARTLCADMGIAPETIDADHKVCSIGFCDAEQKWYGWSPREISGFGIGSPAKNERKTEHSSPKTWHRRWTARTLDDAKQMAIDFANSVA